MKLKEAKKNPLIAVLNLRAFLFKLIDDNRGKDRIEQ